MIGPRFRRVVLTTGLLQATLFGGTLAYAQSTGQAPPLPPPSAPPPAAAQPAAPDAPAVRYADDDDDDPRVVRRRRARREGAYVVDYDDGGPVPAGYHPETRARRGYVIGGAVLFGVTYLLSTLAAAISDDTTSHADALYVPVVGPFIQIGSTDTASGKYVCVIDGLAQAGGLAMFVYGIASPRTVLVRDGFGIQTLLPRPYVTAHGGGFGLTGQF